MKRHIVPVLLILTLSSAALAQGITTNLVVNSNPSAILSEWANDNSVITFVTIYPQGKAIPAIIKTELKLSDGTVIARKDLAKAETYNIAQGTQVFYARDVIPMEIMFFSGSYKSALERTGKLPSGYYQLSVQLVKPGTYEPLTEVQNKFFNVAAIHLPILIKPGNGDSLMRQEAQTAIMFRWTPASPLQKNLPHYRIQVFEVYEYQQSVQALRSNQPILDITLTAVTQYIWRPQISFIDDPAVKMYIWTIQTLDADNNPFVQTDGNGESRSEPLEFYVTH
jgi:hypothetical protein